MNKLKTLKDMDSTVSPHEEYNAGYVNGLFQNIENTHSKNEVYGSSVVKYKLINDVSLGDKK